MRSRFFPCRSQACLAEEERWLTSDEHRWLPRPNFDNLESYMGTLDRTLDHINDLEANGLQSSDVAMRESVCPFSPSLLCLLIEAYVENHRRSWPKRGSRTYAPC